MKTILRDNHCCVLRFDRGEELIGSLLNFLPQEKITAGTITGIGTCTDLELGYYHKESKQYEKRQIMEDMEVLSLIGNASLTEGKPALHLHGSFGKRDFSVIGGHVFSLTVAATIELNLTKLDGVIERKNNPELNLNLLD